MKANAKIVAAVTVLGVFVAGVVVGFSVDRMTQPKKILKTYIAGDIPGMLEKLDLTSAQRTRANEILERQSPAAEAVLRSTAERLRLIADSLDAELRAILTPAQRARMDSLRPARPFVLRKKSPGPNGTIHVDTLLPGRDSTRR
jgi:hypothetical protein